MYINQRNTYLDVTKGITIFLVVMGHCLQFGGGFQDTDFFNNDLFKFIYSFHMPLFMAVSGYLFCYTMNRHSVKGIIKSRFITLLIPILTFSTIDFIFRLVTQKVEMRITYLVIQYIINIVCNLWFLWAVFYCSFVVLIVNKIFHDSIWVYIVGFIVSFFVPDVLNLSLYKFVYPFFVAGYFYNKYNLSEIYDNAKLKLLMIIISFICYIFLLQQYNYDSYIYTSGHCILKSGEIQIQQLGIDMYRTLIGGIGSVFVLTIIDVIYSWLSDSWVIKWVSILGKNSLGIYAVSSLIFNYVPFISKLKINNHIYLSTLVQSATITLVCLCISIMLRKNKVTNMLFLGARK